MFNYEGSAQDWDVIEDEGGRTLLLTVHDFIYATCCMCLDGCVGTVLTCLQRSLSSTCRVFRCCGWRETVHEEVKLSVEESSPSRVSTETWGLNEPYWYHVHDDFRTIPVYPWMDTHAD